jgi:hypothetical protein
MASDDDKNVADAGKSAIRCAIVVAIMVAALFIWVFSGSKIFGVHARDLDGRFAQSTLKPWFDKLASGKGLCCSFADGYAITDADWETKNGHYRVRLPVLHGSDQFEWVDVPEDALITEPNRAGRTMVWPMYHDGKQTVRCFLPGSMT